MSGQLHGGDSFRRFGRRLQGLTGREFWRSLDELAGSPEFLEALHREFPTHSGYWDAAFSRRDFLRLMGASLALGGLAACGKPAGRILPYAEDPEGMTQGAPLYFSTTLPRAGFARGAVVKSAMGRPVKVEGNPRHPASLGGTDVFMQADILGLYDPDRSQTVLEQGRISTWGAYRAALSRALEAEAAARGAGLRLLTGSVTSPFLGQAIAEVLRRYPQARWHRFEPVSRETVYAGHALAFGRRLDRRFDLSQADVVVGLDCDLFFEEPGSLVYARQFAGRRKPQERMLRAYAAEPSPTLFGSRADHRLPAAASLLPALAYSLARRCGLPVPAVDTPQSCEPWLSSAAADLRRCRGRGLLVAGSLQPPQVHALAAWLNEALGNAERAVIYLEPPEASDSAAPLSELVEEASQGRVQTLLVLDANPVYGLPAADAAAALGKIPFAAHLGLYQDETARLCRWHVPRAHALESWGDALAFDGTASLLQPLIAPLYNGRTDFEFLGPAIGRLDASHDELRRFWSGRGLSAQDAWDDALRRGVVAATAFPAQAPSARRERLEKLPPPEAAAAELEAVLRPDLRLWDGRYANSGWLQEFPDPVTRLTWDNAAWLAPSTARRLGVENEDVLEISAGGRAVQAPVWIVPGQAPGVVGLTMGGGRSAGGRVAHGSGYWGESLRPASEARLLGPVQARKTEASLRLAGVQGHQLMEGRPLVRFATLSHYRKDPLFAKGERPGPTETLYGPLPQGGYAWGMSIDLNACVACGACVVACFAENNSPVVGKEEVLREREMHWIRIDRYYAGSPDAPAILSQPVPCMHCEDAPCELVCPVGATVHSDEGLNEMVYNRCVGTRYCSNNCPYKVRRFNFFDFADRQEEAYKLMRNPDVSVRSRGVMEKCTYCVQRIQEARLAADKQNRLIGDGDIQTACQQACPAQAIVFGDKADPRSRVAKLKASPLDYGLLDDLGTRPRTTYLARVDDPNPSLPEGA